MGAWKQYAKEAIVYKDIADIKLSNMQAKKIVVKLERHFKINWIFNNKKPKCKAYRKIHSSFNRRTTSIAYTFGSRIEFRHNPDLLTVGHECAHLLANRRYGKCCYHNKLFNRELKRICNYIRKKNYFNSDKLA